MSKQIVIVGGGISGLTALHYLRQKYAQRPEVSVRLLEREALPGGTIQTVRRDGFQYETGPNGFLDNKSGTLALAHELGLADDLIVASPATKVRFICVNDILYPLPSNLLSFINFKPLTMRDKLRISQELFIAKGQDALETVYEFGARRLGENFSRYFLDPMVSGIFGGNARDLNLRYAFPRIYEIEQNYSSLFKGMAAIAFCKRGQRQKNSLTAGQPAGRLWSFKKGMGQLVEKLTQENRDSIKMATAVTCISSHAAGYNVQASGKNFFADELILAVPAFVAADLLNGLNKTLAQALCKIPYASLSVVGLAYNVKQFLKRPQGFGYLRPTFEGREVLGVLYSSNIFSGRSPDGDLLFQIMLGGACNPDTVRKSDEELFDLAVKEMRGVLSVRGEPKDRFLLRWGKGIPQYDRAYPHTYDAITNSMRHHPHLHLLANYLGGVSLNDCIANAKHLAQMIQV